MACPIFWVVVGRGVGLGPILGGPIWGARPPGGPSPTSWGGTGLGLLAPLWSVPVEGGGTNSWTLVSHSRVGTAGCLSSVRLSCPLPHAGPRALKASGPGLARVCVCVYVHVCARTRLGEPHTCACAGPRLHVCPCVPVRAHGGLTQGRTSASRKPLLTAPTRSFPALVCLSVGLGLCFWRSAVTR